MKKVMVLVLAAACLSFRVCAADDGRGELAAVSAKYKDHAEKIEAYRDIAKRYPAVAGDALLAAAWNYALLKNVAEAKAVAEGVIRDYPGSTNAVVGAMTCKAWCLISENKCGDALAVYDACLRDYPGVYTASVKRGKASCYFYGLKNAAAGIAESREAIALTPPGDESLKASLGLAWMLARSGNKAEASAACHDAVLKNAGAVGATPEIENAFGQVDPVALGIGRYREFLTGILLRVPATEANAKFLGRVKSEFEKVKE